MKKIPVPQASAPIKPGNHPEKPHVPVITSNGGLPTATITKASQTTAVTTVTVTGTAPIVYSISGGASASLFSINSSTGVLTFKSLPVNGSYNVTVRATNAVGFDQQAITVTVAVIILYFALTMDDKHVPENAADGDLVGNLVVDTNIPGDYTLSIVESPSKFELNTLNTLEVDRSSSGSLTSGIDETLTILATYTGGSTQFPFTITVDPDLSLKGFNIDHTDIPDNATAGTLVGTLSAVGGVPPFTWTRSGNTNFNISGSTLVRSATGTLTANAPENITIRATDSNSSFFEQAISVTVTPTAQGGVTADWLNPPALPTRKIKVHWNAAGDISVPPTMSTILAETTNCWIVENVSGMAAFDGHVYNSLDHLYSVIAPTLDLAGCTAEIDAGYVAQGSNGLVHDVPGVSWAWTCATEWSHTPPFLGGFHYRVLQNHSIHQTGYNDSSFTATYHFKNWFFGVLPCELEKATNLTCAAGSTVGGNTLTASVIGIQSDYTNQYPTEIYRLTFDANTVTPGLRSKSYTITANTTGATPVITISGTWTSSTLPIAGDVAHITAGKQAGDDLFYITRLGLLVREHCAITRGGFNGTAVSAAYEWGLRTQAQIHDFDCMYYGNGGAPTQHNNYIHNVNLYSAVRCFSHDACGASWKAECDSFILDDCTAAGHMFAGTSMEGNVGWGNNNSVCDAQQHVRCYYRNVRVIPTNFDNTWKKRHWSTIQMRLSNLSSHSSLLPVPLKKDLTSNPTGIYFTYGGIDQATTNAAQVATGTSGSTLKLEQVGALLNSNQQSRTLSNFSANAYNVQLYYDDGTIYTGLFTLVSVVSGLHTGTVSPALTKAASRFNPAIIKLTSDNWDIPVVDISARDWCDPSSSSYLWGAGTVNGIRASDGTLDLYKQKGPVWGFPAQYYDGCFMTPTHQTLSQAGLIINTKDCYNGTFNQTSNVVQVPLPPLKSNTGDWPDPANAGYWDGQLHVSAPGLGVSGTGGTGYGGSDFVRPNMTAVRHHTWWVKNMTGLSYHVDLTSGSASEPLAHDDIPIKFMAIKSTGVVDAAQNQAQNLFEIPVMFQSAGTAAAGSNTIASDTLVGLSVGMFLSIACDNQWGSDLGVHNCTITAINPTTKVLTFTPALPTGAHTFKAVQTGYKMAAIPSATWPAWALDPETDF